ncbi:transposase [Acidithiobacillus sp. MC6.1]|nr:transposase [Acidithiobacillus sp. MC6.1]
MPTVTYEYGIRTDAECLHHVDEQIRLMRQTYNEMIAVMHEIHAASQAYQLTVAGLDAKTLSDRITALNDAFKCARAAQDDERMKTVATERRECWKDLSVLLKVVRQEHKQELQMQFYSRIGANKDTETYQIRCKAVAAGLGWATAQTVLKSTIVAWNTSMRLGKAPRFARGDEKTQDALVLQFTTKGGLTQDKLFAGACNEFGIDSPDAARKRQYWPFWFRLGGASAGAYAKGSIHFHRPLPEQASVAIARLVRKRTGCRNRYFLQLVLNVPAVRQEVTHKRKPLAAVHMGWSADSSGRRVCGFSDTPEPGLAQVIRLPPSIENDLHRAQDIQGQRDKARDAMAPLIRAFGGPLPPEWTDELLEYWRRWKVLPATHMAASRIHAWAHRMGDFAPEWWIAWCKADRKQWLDATHIAKRARNRRKTFYREFAKSLATGYEAIALETADLKKASKIVDEVTGERTDLAKKARTGRVVASLYVLEMAIRWAAEKWGAAVLDIEGVKTTQTCGICGAEDMDTDAEDSQVLHCASCGAVVDRKQNGAAVAWQTVMENRENLVTDYWALKLEQERDTGTRKTERLEKMQAARRAKRERTSAE